MKKILLLSLLICSTVLDIRAQDAELDEEQPEGKVKYALILPEEKAPELVKTTEASPFGGVLSSGEKDNESGEEIRVSEMLRSLKVVGKSSAKKWVMLGDLILRKGDLVPPIINNQSVQLLVRDVTSDYVEMVWVEKKPTGQEPRRLVIQTDVSPQVMHRLPGSSGSGGSSKDGRSAEAVMSVMSTPKRGATVPEIQSSRAVVVEAPPTSGPLPESNRPKSEDSGANSLLKLFFGTPVSTDTPPAPEATPAPAVEKKP